MGQEQPLFSIIIPTYSRPKQLATCLESLTRQEYPGDRFEIIVVDDGSKPPIEPAVAPFRDRLNLIFIRQANAGPSKARNTGAVRARGRFLAFIDDDCTPARDWLKTLAAHFATAPERLIGGKTINALPNNPFSTTSQLIIDAVYSHYNANPNQARFFASNNLALPAEYFRAVDGFDPAFRASEDREFCDRWLSHSYQMLYAPDVQIYHAHNLSLRGFWRQHFSYGRGAFRFYQRRSERTSDGTQVEPNFYLKLLTYPFVQAESNQPKLLLAALLVLSQVASTIGLFWERMNQPSKKLIQAQTQAD